MPLPSPLTENTSTDDVGITLENNKLYYRPGDVVTGKVYRQAPAVGPETVIDVWLCGRTKSELKRGDYYSETYRGHFTLIDPKSTKQRLFSGPIHIPNDGAPGMTWPFSITIPTHINHSRTAKEGSTCDSFLSLKKEDLENTVLPASYEKNPPADFNHGVVDYFIEADLRLGERSSTCKARFPIKILHFNPGPPIEGNDLGCKQAHGIVCTQRLLQGMHDAELSNSQKLKKLFGTSSVPRLGFKFEVWYPKKIQIDNPNPISFQLRVLPIGDESSEEIKDIEQKIRLTRLDLAIQTVVDIKCKARLHVVDHAWRDITPLLQKNSAALLDGIEIPSLKDISPFDVGEAINLRLPTQDSPFALSHTFTTHTVRVSHSFKYNVTCDIAGEAFETHQTLPIDILPPSEACEGPTRALLHTAGEPSRQVSTDEGDLPRSFEKAECKSDEVEG